MTDKSAFTDDEWHALTDAPLLVTAAVFFAGEHGPISMMKEASGLVLNDFDAKDGKAFEQTATWLKNLFQQANIYTRHFSIDPSSFKGPYEKNDVSVK